MEKLYQDYTFEELLEMLEGSVSKKDFNIMGFYRSLLENEGLSVEQAITLRERACLHFDKQIEFLQLKDPQTYLSVTMLGEDYTKGDKDELWRQIVRNQQAILKKKRINHRNFGTYSIHDCGYEWCPYNGLMVRQGSVLAESTMHFETDKSKDAKKKKSLRRRSERKHFRAEDDME